jgi:hypothetical protein
LILEEEGGVLGVALVSFVADTGWREVAGISRGGTFDVCIESCVVTVVLAGSAGIIVSSEGASTADCDDIGGKEPLLTSPLLETIGSSICVALSLDIGASVIELVSLVHTFVFSILVAPDESMMLGAGFVAAFRFAGFGWTRASPASCRRRNSRNAAAS